MVNTSSSPTTIPHQISDLLAHQRAQCRVLRQRAGGLPALGRMHDSLLAVIAARPRARVIASTHGHAEQAYQALLRHLTATT